MLKASNLYNEYCQNKQETVHPSNLTKEFGLSHLATPTDEFKISSGASQSHRGDDSIKILQYFCLGKLVKTEQDIGGEDYHKNSVALVNNCGIGTMDWDRTKMGRDRSNPLVWEEVWMAQDNFA